MPDLSCDKKSVKWYNETLFPSSARRLQSFGCAEMLIANCQCAFQESELLPGMPVSSNWQLVSVPSISL